MGTSDFSDLELSELEAGEVTASSEEEGLVTGRLLQAYYASHKKKTKKSKLGTTKEQPKVDEKGRRAIKAVYPFTISCVVSTTPRVAST